MRDALVRRDAAAYLRLMNASGRSSEQLLRNIRAPGGDDRLERGLQRGGFDPPAVAEEILLRAAAAPGGG